jgi:hypothetical protein
MQCTSVQQSVLAFGIALSEWPAKSDNNKR